LQVQSDAGTAAKRMPVSQERDRAEKRYQQARNVIDEVLEDVRNNGSIDVAAVDETAEELLDSLNTNENALACLSHIRSKDTYLLQHSLNVGILLGIFGRSLRLETSVLKDLVIGGILHDIGKVLVPDEILHKPGKLDSDEWEEMKRHVTYGERILDVTEGLSDLSRSICQLHHERLDGTGYPRSLKAEQIDRFGRMAAICDVYDAVTADRVYHEGMAPDMALRKLIEWSIFHLDKELVYDFIRSLSVYPVGTLVELTGSRAAIIIEANRRSPKQPVVRVFYSTTNRHQIEPFVEDLAKKESRFDIVGTLDARQLNIDVTPFL
jgi:HD-GYP domain-containing protein (c-di-GMP phosphodiesterase class II)